MPDLKKSKPKIQEVFKQKPYWQGKLGEYVTTIAWSPDGKLLAAASAAGEVVLYRELTKQLVTLQAANDTSVDCVSFSADGRWLATAGQDAKINIWDVTLSSSVPTHTLDQGDDWIDQLVWHPTRSQFAFSLGKYVQVWSMETQDIVTTVSFENSSVLALNWHPSGQWLTVGGYQGIKLWNADDWYEDPITFELPTATGLMAWDKAGQYLTANTLDKNVLVLEWLGTNFDGSPWRMQGFPGKIRALDWSSVQPQDLAPILVTCSSSEVVAWRRDLDPDIGWDGEVLQGHVGNVNAIAFQPGSQLLASAGNDGRISLWKSAAHWVQALQNSRSPISCLQWQPQGQRLAVGNEQGDLTIWAESTQAMGFKSR
jgi:WD40 repeat protein